jgi:CRISPR/Cas system CMR-associated protein Cmr5 small subunit
VSVRRIDQDMAAAAAGALPRPVTPELRTRYRQLRVMLHTAGLAATYAFVAAKASGETGQLAQAYDQAGRGIRDRLAAVQLLAGDPARLEPRQVLEQLGSMEGSDYARASAEAAALTGWLSRLADALVQDERRPGTDPGPGPAAEEDGP